MFLRVLIVNSYLRKHEIARSGMKPIPLLDCSIDKSIPLLMK